MNVYLEALRRLVEEPTANLTATAIAFAIVVLILLIITLILLLIALRPAESERPTPVEHAAPAEWRPRSRLDVKTWMVLWIVGIVLFSIALFASTSTDRYCADVCHSMVPAADRWESGPHSSVSCVDCHEAGAGTGLLTSAASRLQDVADTILPGATAQHPRVPADACLHCHESVCDQTLTTDRGIRVAHRDFLAEGAPCETCHGNVGHPSEELEAVRGSIMSSCLRCHDDETASAECATCHVGDPGMTPIVERKPVRVEMPSPTCGGCHQQQTCDACHGIRMPHPDDFADPHQHARPAAFAAGKDLCYGCHVESDCSSCHQRFETHGEDWALRHTKYTFADGNGYCLWCHKTPDFCRVCH